MSAGFQPARIAFNFTGRIAVVTGAAGGIGAAIARRLGAGGAKLCLIDNADLSGLARELMDTGVDVIVAACDVSDSAQVENAVAEAVSRFSQIDILVAAAGIVSFGAIESIAESEWDRVHRINLKGVFLFNQAVIASMKPRGYGRIVNIGSVLAKNGGNPRPWLDPSEQARAGNVAYGAAKAGVHALTLFLAKEVASYGITVNAVSPGPIASAMTWPCPRR
jgi:3-oxoacyl-[acyl-carrier protein] reductase